jgi:hypothetical protein
MTAKKATALLGIAVVAAVAVLYVRSWTNPFVLDDVAKIEANPDLRLPFSLRNFVAPYSGEGGEARNDPSRPLAFMVY